MEHGSAYLDEPLLAAFNWTPIEEVAVTGPEAAHQYLTFNNVLIEADGPRSIYDANLQTLRWQLSEDLSEIGSTAVPSVDAWSFEGPVDGYLPQQVAFVSTQFYEMGATFQSTRVWGGPIDEYLATPFFVRSRVLDQVNSVQGFFRPRSSRVVAHLPEAAVKTYIASFESVLVRSLILYRCGFSEFSALSRNHSGVGPDVEVCSQAISDRGDIWIGSFNSCDCYSTVKSAVVCALFSNQN